MPPDGAIRLLSQSRGILPGDPHESVPILLLEMQYGVLPVTVRYQNLCSMPVYAKHGVEKLCRQYFLQQQC